MATTVPVRHARRALVWLGIIHLVLIGILAVGMGLGKTGALPKLALDLEGGTEMILTPQLNDPNAQVTPEQLAQAVQIIRERVDGTGVSEAEITTQNNRNVVVSMPGTPDERTRQLIMSSAQMQFRPVLEVSQNVSAASKDQRTPDKQLRQPSAKPDPDNGSDPNWITPALQKKFESWDCAAEAKKEKRTTFRDNEPAIACETAGDAQDGQSDGGQAQQGTQYMGKYLLGPVEVSGMDISDATAGQATNSQGYNTGQWAVNLSFNGKGAEAFKKVTSRLVKEQEPRNQFAIVLDGNVISAPRSQAAITDGRSQITGNFTQQSATELAQQLKYGALPMSFTIQTEQQVSATLGTDQLKMGLIAGLIGLGLVALYSFFQYRLLGLVTISSLIIAGVLTYLAIVLLGWGANYRLSLAGVAGIIVSIGLTADSFIVYFERIRDELRDGRSLTGAVEMGWSRAKRTIVASKAVNLLAAVVLYFVAVGNVKGFAFTLGLTAIADLVVVFLFTHPVMQLLGKTRFFGEGHRLSGLDPSLLGAEPLYRGAGRVRQRREPGQTSSEGTPRAKGKNSGASKEAARRMTIAERRRAEELARRGKSGGSGDSAASGTTTATDSTTDTHGQESDRG